MRGWNCEVLFGKMQMSSLTVSGFCLFIWLTSDEKLLFTNIVHNVVMESELPSHILCYKGRLETRSTSFFQGSLELIYVASILFWGHFWQSLCAWCQWVKDHEHILFQDHWSRTSHQKNSAGFQVSTESGLQETFLKKITVYFSLKKHFF